MSNIPEILTITDAFSSEVDHTTMTGGTCETRKILKVKDDKEHLTIVPTIVLFPLENNFTDLFHKGIHTLEHFLAYFGGLRDELVSISDDKYPRNVLVDISPFIHTDGRIGFRLLSLTKLDEETLLTAVQNALQNTLTQLKAGDEVPFANQEQCGQFNFHDRESAIEIISSSDNGLEIITEDEVSFGTSLSVSDLRLLKPELEGLDEQFFLPPEVSYAISLYLEKMFDSIWQELGFGEAPKLFVGTYGCMTGMYIISELLQDNTVFAHKLHVTLTAALIKLQASSKLDPDLHTASEKAVQLIAKHQPSVYQEAQKVS